MKKKNSRPVRSQAALPETKETPPRTSRPLRAVAPQWSHPLVASPKPKRRPQAGESLQAFAYDFYLRFLPFFRDQPEGSLSPSVEIEFTTRMRQKLGLAYLFEHKIRLNQSYFAKDPSLLPYTLFHEMTHLWLYDCQLDPGHTRRFYNKMREFESTGLPVDPDVHIHTRVAPEGKYVYSCPNCKNRWYLRDRLRYSIYCGHCFDREGVEYYAKRLKVLSRPEAAQATDSDTAA
jgi:predicted SprT family Zn-dependent metalloprotease